MRKRFFVILLFILLYPCLILPNEGIAYIENPLITDSTFSWEIHYERTDEWSADTLSNVFGSSALSFNFNDNALSSPVILIEPGSPIDNANYFLMLKIISGKFIVDIDFNSVSSVGVLPLNTKVKLLTIRMQITDSLQTAALSWDALNTGFFDNTDQNVTTDLLGSFNEPLPVELASFTARTIKNDVLLNWQTKTEVNNYGFEIERKIIFSTDDDINFSHWYSLGFIEGAGNSNSPKDYYFTDKEPTGGSKFSYRLKQIDNDGTYTYSGEVIVELYPSAYELFQNYPNPFNPVTTIKFTILRPSLVRLKVYDLLGQEVATLINEVLPAGRHKAEFNGSGSASGIYFYRLETEGFVSTRKMTCLK